MHVLDFIVHSSNLWRSANPLKWHLLYYLQGSSDNPVFWNDHAFILKNHTHFLQDLVGCEEDTSIHFDSLYNII